MLSAHAQVAPPVTAVCEHREPNEPPCGCRALWRVQLGGRRSDAQDSCGAHLAQTCTALLQGEYHRPLSVTVAAGARP